jgi:hypothetical protein
MPTASYFGSMNNLVCRRIARSVSSITEVRYMVFPYFISRVSPFSAVPDILASDMATLFTV